MVRSTRRRVRVQRSLAILGAAVGASLSSFAWGATGQWNNAAGGNWNVAETTNWNGGIVADGADSLADFSTIDITADRTVALTEARTIGNLTFGDTATGTSGSWILNGAGTLTLSTTTGSPTITVNTLGIGKNVVFNMAVAGSGGLTKAGIGQLVLNSTDNSYTGATTINRGTLTYGTAGSLTSIGAGTVTVNAAGAVNYGAATVLDATFLGKINTASTGALAITATDATTNFNFTAGALSSYTGMSIGAVIGNTVTYTGTITPAASTYRLGGGGGTLRYNNVLAAGNSLVVGNGAGATGTVVLANSTNTYDGTTTIANGMTLEVGTGGTFASMSAANIANDGALVINRTGAFTESHTITGTGSYNKRGNGGTVTFTGNFTGGALNIDHSLTTSTPVLFDVQGGTILSSALSTIQGQLSGQTAATFQLTSGSASFAGGIRSDNSDTKATIKVVGGTFNASDVSIQRNSGTAPDYTSGFIVTGGTVNIGTASMGTGNSVGNMSIEGGSVTATGTITLGNQITAGRGGAMRVTGGTFTAPRSSLWQGQRNCLQPARARDVLRRH